jgi:restriction endonuclease Mrr
MTTDKSLYYKIIDILEVAPMHRRALIDAYIDSLPLTKAQRLDKSTSGEVNIKRSIIGTVIDEMTRKGIILRSDDGVYTAHEQKPVVIRSESCEAAVLSFLAEKDSATKGELRAALAKDFGTEKTLTAADDNRLFSTLSVILKRLVNDGVIAYSGKRYTLPPKIEARIDDINGLLRLKEKFRSSVYKKGGEFFEYYFMSLLEKYLTLHHKTVISNTVTAGSMDGGIDGIIETVDTLGFKETIMVQTKNRTEIPTETDVRGFYGAVCARQGSRGIYAITSTFHPGAQIFLDSIDNCVGVDGEMLFKMAMETGYGITKCNDVLCVDENII